MKVYRDMCCLKRPFDDESDARIQMETLAVEAVLQLCRDGHQDLIASDALRFENANNPNLQRQQFAEVLLALALHDQFHSPTLEQQAQIWQNAVSDYSTLCTWPPRNFARLIALPHPTTCCCIGRRA